MGGEGRGAEGNGGEGRGRRGGGGADGPSTAASWFSLSDVLVTIY